MAYDDYEDRRRESNEYLDRRQDRLDFEARQSARSSRVHEAIRKKDYSTAYRELGIAPSDSSGTSSGWPTPPESSRPPPADEQFREHSTKLVVALRYSTSLPAHVTEAWISEIGKIDMYQPTQGLAILYGVVADYWRASNEYEPHRDIFDLAVAKTMQFNHEMQKIKGELDWLEAILKHVEAYFQQRS